MPEVFASGRDGSPGHCPIFSGLQRHRRNRLSKLSFEELRTLVEASDVLDDLELTVLSEKYTGRYLTEIRANLGDGYKHYFDIRLARLASLYASDDLVSKVRKMEDNLRRGLVSRTLSALCSHSDRSDLNLIRETLDKWDVKFSPTILRFLGRFGDWSDLTRILAFVNRYPGRLGILSTPPEQNVKAIAAALYMVGKSRLIDLLGLETENAVRRAIVREFTQKDIAGLRDDALINQLNSVDDQFRKLFALKCALSLSQARSLTLLKKYIEQKGQSYYNSIHWLDLGATMERSIVKGVAKCELARMLS